ncbi:flagellar basal body P-ring formation chaperone FlgA [Tepidamorphus sp. 3E244]|uniref:flagellar basal body P-ring formation chaperone FlgA n=1 Tax=Tepidamorphus sp. 3E244 TaxID=3385498 RepID=UPI0038FCDFFA
MDSRILAVHFHFGIVARAAVTALVLLGVVLSASKVYAQGAASKVTLRSTVTVSEAIVHLGDLVDDAGDLADIQLFRAPAPGTSGTVQASRVVEAIRAHGIAIVETRGITEVVVARAGRAVTRSEIASAIADELIHRGHARDIINLEVRLDSGINGFNVEATASGPVRIVQIQADPRARRFSARITIDGSAIVARGVDVSGYAEEVADVPTLSRSIQRGETISPADITVERLPVSMIHAEAVLSADMLAGMAARRTLRAGEPLRHRDVMQPIIVRRDDVVAIVFERPGLTLSVRGRSLSNGSRGDVVAITNLQSNRIIQAEITGPGTVTVRGTSARLATAASN